MTATIGIIGATGVTGEAIAAAFRRSGTRYRVIGRSETSLRRQFGGDPLAEIRAWNTDDPESVRVALGGLTAAVYCVGVDYTQFALHPKVMRATITGAVSANVERLLLIGTVYSYGRPQTVPVTEAHPRDPHTFKGMMRKEQEDLLLEAHAAGRIKGTILRLPDFYGPGVEKSFFASAFEAALNGRTAQVVGPIDRPHQFIFVPDVGPVVERLLAEPRAYGRSWHLAGPETITIRDFVDRIFVAVGRKPKMMVATPLMVRLIGLFNPLMREVAEMQYLFSEPVILDDTALHELLGDIPKTSYDDGIRLTLDWMRARRT